MSDAETKNFFRDNSVHADPYPYLEALRAEGVVHREPFHDVVMITGYDEAVAVAQDAERFSSVTAVTGPFPGFPVPFVGDDITAQIEEHRDKLPFSDQLPTLDPPTHTAHRALLMKLITPKRLKENEDAMAALADEVLDEYLASGKGDFISGFASPFTLLVIADLLGVPREDRTKFVEGMTQGHTGSIGGTGEGDELAHNPLEFLYGQFSGYIEDRRANPREDVLTGLALATFPDGSTPEVIDVVRVAANVFSAGQETTVRLLSAAAQYLAEDAELQALLRAEPQRISNFIEESLRTESPVKGDFRLAKVPVTVGGVDLPAGTTVMVVNSAANRDPRRFEDPARFDVARANARQHISFGRGIHTCPGAPLARAESRVGIQRFLERTTDIRIDEALHGPAGNRNYRYIPTFILRGLTHLNLEFDAIDDKA